MSSPNRRVASFTERTISVVQVRNSDLLQHLLQRADGAKYITDDVVRLRRVVKRSCRVCQTAQRLVGFICVGYRVVKRGHWILLHE